MPLVPNWMLLMLELSGKSGAGGYNPVGFTSPVYDFQKQLKWKNVIKNIGAGEIRDKTQGTYHV